MHEKIRNALIINKIKLKGTSKTVSEKTNALNKVGRDYKLINDELLVYDSKGGLGVNLNCEVLDRNGNEIACRHLASYLATESKRGIKYYHVKFGQKERLANIPYLKNNEHDDSDISRHSDLHYLFSLDRFGKALAFICANLKAGEETSLLLGTNCHLMCFTLLKKLTSNATEQWIIKFYDPNVTDQHIRIIASSLSAIKTLTLSDLLDTDDLSLYEFEKPFVAFHSTKQAKSCPIEIVDVHDITRYLNAAMEFNMSQLILRILGDILFDSRLPIKQKLDHIQGESNRVQTDIFTPLAAAFKFNQASSIFLFTQVITHSNLPISYQLKILLGITAYDRDINLPQIPLTVLLTLFTEKYGISTSITNLLYLYSALHTETGGSHTTTLNTPLNDKEESESLCIQKVGYL